MSTTAKQARNAVKARLAHASITIPLYWSNEHIELPDEPTAFAFVVFDNDGPGRGPASFGDGINGNRWRNYARVEAFVFVPRGSSADLADDHAESIAARLRSFRDNDISCFGAAVRETVPGHDLKPPGLDSEVGNYWCAIAEVDLFFDQIG